jgi:pimeloyl-ACP methyl ester carboxylesterase
MKKQLIIIPGVGDGHPIYNVAAKWFSLFGFTTHISLFGWNSADPLSHDERLRQLAADVDALEGAIYLLGVSAGGTAAVSCLAKRPEKITKVATICSPLLPFSYQVNPLLEVAIAKLQPGLEDMDESTKHKILSVRAIYDQTVPTRLSQPAGIRTVVLPSAMHAVTIFLGLTVMSFPVLRFFKQR